MSEQDQSIDSTIEELLGLGYVEEVKPLTAAEHRAVAVDLLDSLTYAGRGSAELELVKATAALAHATLGGPIPESGIKFPGEGMTLEEATALAKDPTTVDRLSDETLIENLDIPVRGKNALKLVGVKTVGQLCKLTFAELLEVPNIGRSATLERIQWVLRQGNRELRQERNEPKRPADRPVRGE